MYKDATQPGHGASGRHRSVRAEAVDARTEDRARGESGIPRSPLPDARQRAATADDAAIAKGLTRASGCRSSGTRRDQRSSRRRSRGSSSSTAAISIISKCPATLADNVLDGDALKPALAKRGIVLHRAGRAVDLVLSSSIWTTRSSAATRRRRSRCAARSAWATTAMRASGRLLNGQAIRRDAAGAAAAVRATIRNTSARYGLRSGRRPRAARPLRLQGSRRRRLPRDCPTASR